MLKIGLLAPVILLFGSVSFSETTPPTDPSSTVSGDSVAPVADTASTGSSANPPAKRGAKWILLANADLRGGWTTVKEGKGARGLSGSAMVLPALQLPGKGGVIIPIYGFNGTVSDRVVEEAILFESRQLHMASVGYKRTISGDLEGRISGDGAWAFTKETRDEKFGKGLYDYRDFGGRASLSWNLKRDGKAEPVTGGFKYFRRGYPNFKSLASENQQFLLAINPAAATALGDKEKNPKDFTGYELSFGAERWLLDSLKGKLDYILAIRSYSDRYLRTDQGEIADKKRSDAMHRVETRFDWGGVSFLPLWTAVDCMYFGSNGSSYDAGQVEHAYTPNFYQFYTLDWRAGLAYQLPIGEELHPSVSFGVSAGIRNYTDRRAQDAGGVNGDDKQSDTTMAVNLGANYPVTKWLGVVAGASGQKVSSNNKFEQYLKYSYDLLTVTLGLTAQY